ncbi:hypothetical protein FOA52_005434 [Chlamydomonas sp. UWO 241]|nr:hypothetical protein FOA52_005434 [Chlamydomonas sp. UWO 241]
MCSENQSGQVVSCFMFTVVTKKLNHCEVARVLLEGEPAKVSKGAAKWMKDNKSGDGAKLKAWKPYGGMKAMFVSLGTSADVGSLNGCVFPSCMVASMKSNDLFVTKYRAELGIKPAPKAAPPATRK